MAPRGLTLAAFLLLTGCGIRGAPRPPGRDPVPQLAAPDAGPAAESPADGGAPEPSPR
jgi:hypothetical protein